MSVVKNGKILKGARLCLDAAAAASGQRLGAAKLVTFLLQATDFRGKITRSLVQERLVFRQCSDLSLALFKLRRHFFFGTNHAIIILRLHGISLALNDSLQICRLGLFGSNLGLETLNGGFALDLNVFQLLANRRIDLHLELELLLEAFFFL